MRRATAAATALLALSVAGRLAAAGPLGTAQTAIVATVATATALTAARLWWTECFCARVGAGLLATLTAAGAVLGNRLGYPGQPAAPWSSSGFALVVLSVFVLLLATSTAAAPRGEDDPAHPYAL